MNKAANTLRLFLCTCSGEDGYIINRCSKLIQIRFALIGFFVLLIFFGCFWSATFFTYSLFDGAKWVSVPIGLVWGTIVANIYLLLLHTISPKLLPISKKLKNSSENQFVTTSMFLRLSLMTLLAIIIAQPLNVVLLKNTVTTSLDKIKTEMKVSMFLVSNKSAIENEINLFNDFNKKIRYQLSSQDSIQFAQTISIVNAKVINDNYYFTQTKNQLKQIKKFDKLSFIKPKEKQKRDAIVDNLNLQLNNEIETDSTFVSSIAGISIANLKVKMDFDNYKSNLTSIINQKKDNNNLLINLLDKSNFYVKTIQLLLHENPISWIITIIVCLIFLLPIYFKFKIRDVSKIFFDVDYKDNLIMQRIRKEIIDTKDFNWLESKIKSITIKDFQTSDYYFKRMLIEHRIVLEEYEHSKRKYSKLLTENGKIYNKNILKRLNPYLEKLKDIKSKSYSEIKEKIDKEYKDEVFTKYEYWIDAPFRTIKKSTIIIKNNETDFLKFLYPDELEE